MSILASLHADVVHLPPVTCASWCQRHDGHPTEVFTADQVCMSTGTRIPVRWDGDAVEVYVIGTVDGEALITLSVETPGHAAEVHLTVGEARRLLAGLSGECRTADAHNTAEATR